MKHTLLGLMGVLIVTGAGCGATGTNPEQKSAVEAVQLVKTMATTPKDVPTVVTVAGISSLINTENSTQDEIYKAASKALGFHYYYPTFIPDNVALSNEVSWTKNSASIFLSKDPGNTNLPSIMIIENPASDPTNTVQKRLGKLTTKENITINGRPGYYGVYDNTAAKFETVIFSTEDGVDVGIWSKQYPKNVLIHVAESLK